NSRTNSGYACLTVLGPWGMYRSSRAARAFTYTALALADGSRSASAAAGAPAMAQPRIAGNTDMIGLKLGLVGPPVQAPDRPLHERPAVNLPTTGLKSSRR